MGLYDGIKDVAKVMQQADNIELYQKLLDLSVQALDMQAEIAKLREENAALKKGKDIESRIVRHDIPIVTLKDDSADIKYCANCWDSQRKLIQMHVYTSYGCLTYRCHSCELHFG